MRQLLVLAASILVLSACKRSSEPAQHSGDASQATDGATQTTAPADAAADSTAYVTSVTVLKIEAGDATKVKDSDGKEVNNFRAVLYRGEQVKVLETKEDWVRVRSSGDVEGWLKRAAVLEAADVKEATVLAEEKRFDRPDLLASNVKRTIAPGTFLLVVKEKAPFSEANYAGSQNTWMLTDRLATDPKDVAAAKLVEKARYLAKNKKVEEAVANLEIIRSVAPESPLVQVLAVELGVEKPEGEAGSGVEPQPASAQGNAEGFD